MLDGDDAGQQGTAAAANVLRARMPVAIIPLEPGTQPDQLQSNGHNAVRYQ